MKAKNDFNAPSSLLLKFLQNELSPQEQQDFELWLSADPRHRELLESFKNTAQVQQELNQLHAINMDEEWNRFSEQLAAPDAIQENPAPVIRKSVWTKVWRYSAAAVLLLTVGISIYRAAFSVNVANAKVAANKALKYDIMPGQSKAVFQTADGTTVQLDSADLELKDKNGVLINAKDAALVYSHKERTTVGYNVLTTPKSGEYKMVLPDGTKVWLNAASSLRFSTDFNAKERRVSLTGEAYFEVAHNKAVPFIVSFNQTQVEVLGTHFNINAYQEGNSKTTLIEGAVKLSEGLQQQTLKPGDQATVKGGAVSIRQIDTYGAIAWKDGVFYFNDDQLKDILDEVSRWYDVVIVYEGKQSTKRYKGNIRRQATLKQVLEMLTVVSGDEFNLEGRTVTVRSK